MFQCCQYIDRSILILIFHISFFTNTSLSEEPEALETLPLIGFRELNPNLIISDGKEVAGIPSDIFIAGVKSSDEVRKALRAKGINEEQARVEDWFSAAQTVASSMAWNTGQRTPSGKMQVIAKSPFSGKNDKLDGNLFVDLSASELFPTWQNNKLQNKDFYYKGKEVNLIRTDVRTTTMFKQAYDKIPKGPPGDPSKWKSNDVHNWSNEVVGIAGSLTAKPSTYNSITLKHGSITFGEPLIHNVAQSKPLPVGEEGQVLSVEFFFTIRNLNPKKIKNLSFCVEISPPTVISLELVPELRKSGDQYKNLKPKIIPGGLRENQVFWSMSGDAIEKGSYAFTAKIRVPSKIQSINISQSMVGRTVGSLWIREQTIGTPKPVVRRIAISPEVKND
ncbi:hypothetical protein [Gimesia aquarii]|uniref:Uncharacterized protein n=1 Tax=Gimesia aquarii TaxID=2527964 RepID=A0A517VS14_9PLAN|nr:hypothetical protein [Gimesia aquarii]QDT95812.1 hypothetical protein V144x_12590 [Gimesia aquarii]